MKVPVIGIVAKYYDGMEWHMPRSYFQSVEAAGGVPVILPPVRESAVRDQLLGMIDGLLLPGGGDVHPARYGAVPDWVALRAVHPERDEADFAYLSRALEMAIPVLGICRGCQIICAQQRGTLRQHIGDQLEATHGPGSMWPPAHAVTLDPESQLARVFGATEVLVNSAHHQAVQEVPPGWKVTAQAPDGTVEAIEPVAGPGPSGFLVGVQWHPEEMIEHDPVQLKLFRAIVEAAAQRRTHHGMPTSPYR